MKSPLGISLVSWTVKEEIELTGLEWKSKDPS